MAGPANQGSVSVPRQPDVVRPAPTGPRYFDGPRVRWLAGRDVSAGGGAKSESLQGRAGRITLGWGPLACPGQRLSAHPPRTVAGHRRGHGGGAAVVPHREAVKRLGAGAGAQTVWRPSWRRSFARRQ